LFHSNCGSIVLSFLDMTMGRTMDDRRMDDGWTDIGDQSLKMGQQ